MSSFKHIYAPLVALALVAAAVADVVLLHATMKQPRDAPPAPQADECAIESGKPDDGGRACSLLAERPAAAIFVEANEPAPTPFHSSPLATAPLLRRSTTASFDYAADCGAPQSLEMQAIAQSGVADALLFAAGRLINVQCWTCAPFSFGAPSRSENENAVEP